MGNPKQQKDNSTFEQKVKLRVAALRELACPPVVLEAHGGYGKLWSRCYRDVAAGVVFEKDANKSARLGLQRPTWAVYEADCEQAIRNGAGAHLAVNFVDFDPYGEPWPVIEAFFASQRPWPDRIVVVVNDGLRRVLQLNKAWTCRSLAGATEKYGNVVVYREYLRIARDLLSEKAALAGYDLKRWTGYYCGFHERMTHYSAVLEKHPA